MFVQQDGGTRRGGRRVGSGDGCSFDLYTGILSWVENLEFVTLRNTSCYKSTSQS